MNVFNWLFKLTLFFINQNLQSAYSHSLFLYTGNDRFSGNDRYSGLQEPDHFFRYIRRLLYSNLYIVKEFLNVDFIETTPNKMHPKVR